MATVPAEVDAAITKYNAAKQALAEAHSIDEVKDIRDKAVALRTYAMQARDRVLIDQATEIRLRAERRAGELLKQMDKNQGGVGGKTGSKGRPALDSRATLADLNINKSQSSRWQKLADMSKDKFEEVVTRGQQKASAAIDRAQNKPKPNPRSKGKQSGKRDKLDIIAACVSEVELIVRAAIAEIRDKEARAPVWLSNCQMHCKRSLPKHWTSISGTSSSRPPQNKAILSQPLHRAPDRPIRQPRRNRHRTATRKAPGHSTARRASPRHEAS
jgi:hypothetical protein